MKPDIRKIALAILTEQESAGKYINLALSSHKADGLSSDERASLTALLYTAAEKKLTYDYYISAISKRESEKIDPYTRNILRLGLCQLLDMKSIPDFAAVNETVKLARNSGERSFVNGVLRSAQRAKESLPMPSEEKNYKRFLSVKYSFPLWIVKALDGLFGREETEKILDFYNTEKYTDITVNTTKISVSDYKGRLSAAGIEAEEFSSSPSLRIKRSVKPEALPGFAEGHFFVQDRASLISAAALGAKAGELIIDCCACPGGKSFATAILTDDKADIRSFDLHGAKLSLISGGSSRLGLSSVKPALRDALVPDPELFGLADRVICDAPCSGLGVLGKKADLRYKAEENIGALPELQYSILKESAKYLKVGGSMTYSTCTLLPAENGEIIEKFLAEHENFAPADFEVFGYSSKGGALTLVPSRDGCDGFFVARLERRS